LKDNPDMALKYLERKRKKEFSTRNEITWEDWWAIEYKITDKQKNAIESIKSFMQWS
jgi:hypothetical protein